MMIAFKYNKLHCVNASHEDSNWLSAKSSYSSAFAEFPHGLSFSIHSAFLPTVITTNYVAAAAAASVVVVVAILVLLFLHLLIIIVVVITATGSGLRR
ncbi:transmembrane protein, putative [Medicago truncatula]|uniref:Transmembrane protein, putative n=1 Tax=Medicago truncatula TaxID=3880 RepID=A0A072VPQ6_MEDTR|nr:transmembrane protein, putative [Medicago truncatula]